MHIKPPLSILLVSNKWDAQGILLNIVCYPFDMLLCSWFLWGFTRNIRAIYCTPASNHLVFFEVFVPHCYNVVSLASVWIADLVDGGASWRVQFSSPNVSSQAADVVSTSQKSDAGIMKCKFLRKEQSEQLQSQTVSGRFFSRRNFAWTRPQWHDTL